MTYTGHVADGVVKLDGGAILPDGVKVSVIVEGASQDSPDELRELLLRHAGVCDNLPSDLAENHDYYAHGKPKQ
jgi:hypothetical protein